MRRFFIALATLLGVFALASDSEARPWPAYFNWWMGRCNIGPVSPKNCTIAQKVGDDVPDHWVRAEVVFEPSLRPMLRLETSGDQHGRNMLINIDGKEGFVVPFVCDQEKCSITLAPDDVARIRDADKLYIGYLAAPKDERVTWLYFWIPGLDDAIRAVVGLVGSN